MPKCLIWRVGWIVKDRLGGGKCNAQVKRPPAELLQDASPLNRFQYLDWSAFDRFRCIKPQYVRMKETDCAKTLPPELCEIFGE